MASELFSSGMPNVFQGADEGLVLDYFRSVFQSIAYVAEYREPESLGHLQRVSEYTRFVAENSLGWTSIESRRLGTAALLHDIGKVALLRADVWLKPGPLTGEERQYVQQHTVLGEEIITHLEQNFFAKQVLLDQKLFTYTKQIALYHHENFNGSGYPEGRSGEDIPVAARVVRIADMIDALMSHRPHKSPWPWKRVREEIEQVDGVELDGAILRKLLENEKDFLELAVSMGARLLPD